MTRWAATLGICGLLAACGANGTAASSGARSPSVGGWTTIAPLPVARTSIDVVATPAGLIYAVGGGYVYNHPTGDADVYHPASGTWSRLPSMPQPRATFALAATPSGDIYAFGGFDNGRPVDEIDKFSPATGRWTSPALAPHSFLPMAAATGPDGLVYMLAGVVNARPTGQPPDRLVSYAPETGSWRNLGAAPTGSRLGVTMALTGQTLYIIGGASLSSHTFTSEVTTYSLTTRRWGAAAAVPTPLAFSASAVDRHGNIYVIGGATNSGTSSSRVYVYNPVTNSWTSGPPLRIGAAGLGAATDADGRIYAIGGATTVGHRRVLNTAERLAPAR